VDFGLYARVLWRFRLLVLPGLLLAACLAVLSVVKIGSGGLEYRDSVLWAAHARVGVTQQGFPWGRLFAESPSNNAESTDIRTSSDIPTANPARLNELAVLYAELATSDPVLRLVRPNTAIEEEVSATPLRAAESGTMLPLIELKAISTSPQRAISLAQRSSKALSAYLQQQQRANKVPPSDRVVFEQVLRAQKAEVYRPRSKTMPIVIFVAVVFATVGLAFLLENLRPRRREPGEQSESALSAPAHRRTA
jgi:hypothetical protein